MRGTFLRVGALLLLGLGLLAAAVLYFGSTKIRHGRAYETYFRESVQGLDVGAPVKYRGVTLGQVTEVGLVSAAYGTDGGEDFRQATFRTVLVRFQIDISRVGQAPPTKTAVGEGLRAKLAPQGLTGVSYVELDFVSNPDKYPTLDVPWTPQAEYIPSIPSTLNEVTDAAKSLLRRIDRIDVNALADGLIGLSTDLHREFQSGQAQALLAEATETLRVARTSLEAADLPGLAAELRATSAAARQLAQGSQTRDLLRSATQAADRLAAASTRLPVLVTALEATLRRADTGTADLEQGIVPLLRDARTAAAALRESSEALRRDPSQVLLAGAPPRDRRR